MTVRRYSAAFFKWVSLGKDGEKYELVHLMQFSLPDGLPFTPTAYAFRQCPLQYQDSVWCNIQEL